MENKIYDIAVIGAGPAGLSAVHNITESEPKISVALIEKKTGRDKLIPCAEGVGSQGFREVLEPKESWIRSYVSSAAFHSPDGTTIKYTDENKGYIINRALMQQDLIDDAMKKGVDGYFPQTVKDVSLPDDANNIRKIIFTDGSAISANVVIDTSGPLSRIGAVEGLNTKPSDLEAAYFAHIDGVKTETDTIHVYVGTDIAPGGYAWVFPRNPESVNVGIVIGREFMGKVNIRTLLDKFINNEFPNADIVQRAAGTIPCYTKPQKIATSGLIKAGDAVSTVNPISRAGITEAMKSGKIASEYALLMLSEKKPIKRTKIAKKYEKAWYKKLGKIHSNLARVKKALLEIRDFDYNNGAHNLKEIPQNELTMRKIFGACLGKSPRLLWALRKLM